MVIGGLQKFSALDYPGYLSAIVFTQGCNFRCQFCYNPMLVWPLEDRSSFASESEAMKDRPSFAEATEDRQKKYQKSHSLIPEDDFFDFLRKRQGKLDAVVITGGEPTLHHDLPQFAQKIKELAFKVKLDTNGTNPLMLQQIIEAGLADYLAMDLKAPPDKYEQVTGVKTDFSKIAESVRIIKQGSLPYEFRTTVAPGLLLAEDIPLLGQMIEGAEQWWLQTFQGNHDLVNQSFKNAKAYSPTEMSALLELARPWVKNCGLR